MSSSSYNSSWIDAPDESTFRASFDGITPSISYLESSLGNTAYYLLKDVDKDNNDDVAIEPIIMIHGVCTPALGMTLIAREFQRRRKESSTILLFDVWGHGLSSSPRKPHSPALVVEQILGLMKHLNWSSAHFVGYSLGGSLAINFAALHDDKVRSLFLIAPVGLLSEKNIPSSFAADDLLEIKREPREEKESRKRLFDWLEGAPTITVPSDWKEQIRKGYLVAPALRQWQLDYHQGHLGSVASFMRNGCAWGSDGAYRKVSSLKIPICILLGELDDVSTFAQFDRIGLAKDTVVLPRATHGLARDNVQQVVDCYVNFLLPLPQDVGTDQRKHKRCADN